jgi:copper chaperone CopZ
VTWLKPLQESFENKTKAFGRTIKSYKCLTKKCNTLESYYPDIWINKHLINDMEHTYQISGMSCNGCRKHVEEALANIPGVQQVSVNLEQAEVRIEMESHIAIKTLQKALKDSQYNIYPLHHNEHLGNHEGHQHHETPKQYNGKGKRFLTWQ